MISLKHINKPLVIIVIIGLLLRLYRYTAESIWLDESISIFIAQQSFLDVITFIDPTPPLFYVLLHFWSFISINEWWLKLLPIFLSMASIYMTYLVALKIHSKNTGIIAALFVSLSPVSVFYAQELRAYSLLFFVTTALIYFYLTYNNSTKHKTWYYFFFIATVYTHIYGIFILLAIQIHRLLVQKKHFFADKKWFISHSILTLLSLPWLYKIYVMVKIGEAGWISYPKLIDIGIVYIQSITGVSFFYIVSAITILLSTFMILVAISKKRKQSIVYLWILAPIILPFIASLFVQPFFYPRYALIVSIPLFILIASSYDKLPWKRTIITVFSLTLFILILLQAHSIEKDPWKQIEVTRPVGFIAYYEAFPYIYLHEPECFSQKTIDDVYVCAAEKDIYAIQTDYPPNKKLETIVLSKEWLTTEDTLLAQKYVPSNVSKTEYPTNTDVGIFSNSAQSQPIFVVQP